MRISNLWSLDPKSWIQYFPEDSVPVPQPTCTVPTHGVPPVVHRFHDLFLLEQIPVNLPMIPSQQQELFGRLRNTCSPCPSERCPRPWEERGLRWGIFVVYEQAWYWKGTSLGELIESISLTPQEELEIQIFTWDRTKLSRDLETTDLVDKKSEISLTTHDSSHVLNRMEKERQWQFSANVGFEKGVTVGVDVEAGESVRNMSEKRREQKQELTSKTAQQVRSERKVKISTVREMGIEERRRRLLKNPNPTRSVTHNFYETLSHYQVDIAPVEVRLVVAIPNELPEITPCWIVCNEGILREHLLDETQEPGFEAARRLAVEAIQDPVAAAAQQLRDVFYSQPGAPVHEGDPVPQPEPSPEPHRGPSAAELAGATAAALLLGPLGVLLMPSLHAEAEVPTTAPPSFWEIARFLDAVAQTPSLAGLVKALEMLKDWYTPWEEDGQNRVYQITPEMDGALALATGAVIYETQEIPQMPAGGDETAQQAAQEAWLAWKSEKQQALQTRHENQALFDGLKCHIEENLLHYMRSIWLVEDPGVRRSYLSNRLTSSIGNEFDSLIEEPLLGFHLNCSVFAVKLTADEEEELFRVFHHTDQTLDGLSLQALHTFVGRVNTLGQDLKNRVGEHFNRVADRRFRADARRILNNAVSDGVKYVLTCEKPDQLLTPGLLTDVMTHANRKVSEALTRVHQDQAWENYYLNESEKRGKADTEACADILGSLTVDTSAEDTILEELTGVGRWVVTATETNPEFKTIMVSLPDGGYHCEPVVGDCSGAEKLRERELEAEVRLRELEVDRRKQRLESGNLEPEPPVPTLNVTVIKADDSG